MKIFISGVFAGVAVSFGCLALFTHEIGFVAGVIAGGFLSTVIGVGL